ncbi:MAG: hypothetical protein R3E70_10705 [Burkholderiaceae bacterium]
MQHGHGERVARHEVAADDGQVGLAAVHRGGLGREVGLADQGQAHRGAVGIELAGERGHQARMVELFRAHGHPQPRGHLHHRQRHREQAQQHKAHDGDDGCRAHGSSGTAEEFNPL